MRTQFLSVRWIALLALAWGFSSTVTAQEKASPAAPIPERIRKLIDGLGQEKFAERDRAERELEAIGAAALEPLRHAAKHADAEVSARAVRLVARIEQKMQTDALLTPKRVRLNVKDMPVTDAIALLAKVGECGIDIPGDRTPLANRKITLDTGEVPFWEAFQQLSRAGGLIEHGPQPRTNTPVYYGPNGAIPTSHLAPSKHITVGDGTPADLPTCVTGSVRLRAMAPTGASMPAGESQVVVELTGEQRLQGFAVVGIPIIDKAIDDQAQIVKFIPPEADPMATVQTGFRNVMGGVVIVNKNGVVSKKYYSAEPQTSERTVTLRLKRGDKASKTLKEISGKITVQTIGDSEKLATVPDIRKAAGQKVDGMDGLVQIVNVTEQDGGALAVEILFQNQTARAMRFRGGANWNNNVVGNQNYPKLYDAQGKAYVGEVSNVRSTFGAAIMSQQVTLTYRLQGAQPSELAFHGQRTLLFDVPFTLKNVPLP